MYIILFFTLSNFINLKKLLSNPYKPKITKVKRKEFLLNFKSFFEIAGNLAENNNDTKFDYRLEATIKINDDDKNKLKTKLKVKANKDSLMKDIIKWLKKYFTNKYTAYNIPNIFSNNKVDLTDDFVIRSDKEALFIDGLYFLEITAYRKIK